MFIRTMLDTVIDTFHWDIRERNMPKGELVLLMGQDNA